MKKAITIGALFLLVFSPLATAAALVDAGNATCPVSGDKVSGKDFVEHDGKNYGLCCAGCAKKFSKDPAKYLDPSQPAHDHSM